MTKSMKKNSDSLYVDYLDLPPLPWKRPEGPPRVWRVVEGRRKTANGRVPKFSIQEVPEHLENDVVEFMVEQFMPEEPLAVNKGLSSNPVAVRESRTIWRHAVSQGLSLVALMVNSDPNASPIISGVNVLSMVFPENEATSKGPPQIKNEGLMCLMKVFSNLSNESNVFRKYGVDRYLGAFGLGVHSSFRGQGLGEEIIRARDDIGIAYRIPVSMTPFTGMVAQIVAARAGYEVMIEKKYSELLDDEGNIAFPGLNEKSIKLMVKRLY